MAKGGQVPSHYQLMHSIYHADGGEIKAIPAPASATNTATNTSTATATQDTPVQDRTRKALFHEIGGFANESYADGGTVTAPDYKGVQQKIGDWAMNGMGTNELAAARYFSDPKNGGRPEQELPQDVKQPAVAAKDYRSGGRVPGQAMVTGDSLKNDTQPAMLSPKEIVLPRSITMAPDAPEKAKTFVEAILKKQGHGNSKHHKEFHKALKEAILSRKK